MRVRAAMVGGRLSAAVVDCGTVVILELPR
jgi:hypothetical protein